MFVYVLIDWPNQTTAGGFKSRRDAVLRLRECADDSDIEHTDLDDQTLEEVMTDEGATIEEVEIYTGDE